MVLIQLMFLSMLPHSQCPMWSPEGLDDVFPLSLLQPYLYNSHAICFGCLIILIGARLCRLFNIDCADSSNPSGMIYIPFKILSASNPVPYKPNSSLTGDVCNVVLIDYVNLL